MSFGWWRSTAVGPQVQVPMFYDAHYLFPRAWTQEQAAPGIPDEAPLAFYGLNRVSQPFIGGADNLAMVEIWLAGKAGEKVHISLSSDDRVLFGEQTLFRGRQGGLYQFSFPPISDSNGQNLLLTLSAPEATVEDPVVARTVGGDRLGGSLLLNEYNRPGNLAISSYSRARPGQWWLDAVAEQILPDLFYLRLQQFKPESFKGSFFSLVLLFTVFLSGMFIFLAQPKKQISMRSLQSSLGWGVVIILGLFLLWQIGDRRVRLPLIHEGIELSRGSEAILLAAPAGEGSRIVKDIISDLWTMEREPEARFIHTEIFENLPAIRVPHQSSISFNMDVAPELHLVGGIIAEGAGDLEVSVQVDGENVLVKELIPELEAGSANISWFDVDLSPWTGQGVTVAMNTESGNKTVEGIWILPQIETNAPWLIKEPLADSIDVSMETVRFNETVELLGSSVQDTELRGGETFSLDLYWRPIDTSRQFAKVFVHLIDSEGNLLAQSDGQPVQNAYPIPIWQPGTIIRDSHLLSLPSDIPPGIYQLYVGIYDPDTLQRWSAAASQGSTILNDAAVLKSKIEVTP